jgi:hypothetical protein
VLEASWLEGSGEESRKRVRIALLIILSVHALLVTWSSQLSSVTIDEANHLPAGIAYLERGSFDLYHHNPPLVKLLGGAAALSAGARSTYGWTWAEARRTGGPMDHGGFGWDFQRVNRTPPGHYLGVFRAARLVILLFSILGALTIFAWSRELFGELGALVSTSLWCFSPNVVAHASLFTMDLPAAVMTLLATWRFRAWLRRPTGGGALQVGLLLGLTQLTKFSAALLFLLWPLLAGLSIWRAGARTPPRALAIQALGIVGVSLVVINAGYGFSRTGERLGDFDFLSGALTVQREGGYQREPHHVRPEVSQRRVNRFLGTPLGDLPVPLPAHYLLGLDEQAFETNPAFEGYGYTVYLRGEMRKGGWWYYDLYALLVKSTPGAQLLLLAALVGFSRRARARVELEDELLLTIPPLAMLGSISLLTDLNLGLRYSLVCLPFAMVWAGRLGRLSPSRVWYGISVLGVALHLLATLWSGPNFLSYFGPLVGGPERGHEHLIDSNLDWGQDLLKLRTVLERRDHEGSIRGALWTNMDPAIAGIDLRLVPTDPSTRPADAVPDRDEPGKLRPGLYAMSVNYVMGLPFHRFLSDRIVWFPRDAFAYFQSVEPVERAGHSIWIYELSEEDCERLNRELGLPVPKPGEPIG